MEAIKDLAQTISVSDRSQIVDQVRRWGGLTSDAVLDPTIQIYKHQEIEGFIGYRSIGRCAVVFGDPICPAEDKQRLAEAFHRFIDHQGQSIVYVSVSETFAKWAIQYICGALVEYGEELVFTPPCDPRKKTGANASLVRRKTKQAVREGLIAEEYLGGDLALERAIEQVGEIWLKSRKGMQLHISNVYLFDDRDGKRWFYAKRGSSIVGVITFNRLQAREGCLINHLMITPDAPNGTSELLVSTALETLEKEGCPFATVGIVTTKELGEIVGFSPLSAWIARLGFKIARKIVNLDGLMTFWGKYHPRGERSYLLFSRNHIGLRELIGLKKALSGG